MSSPASALILFRLAGTVVVVVVVVVSSVFSAAARPGHHTYLSTRDGVLNYYFEVRYTFLQVVDEPIPGISFFSKSRVKCKNPGKKFRTLQKSGESKNNLQKSGDIIILKMMRIGGIMAAQAPGAQRRKPLVMATPVGPPASSSSFSSSSYSTSSSAAAAPAYASDDDDDEDDEDDVWAARRPGKQASITCGTKRDAEAAVLRDVLVLKAQYGDLDGVPAHARLQSDFVVTTTKKLQAQLGITFIVAVNNTSAKKLAAKKGQLQINCFYDGKNARKNCKCDFGLSAYVKLGSAIITRIGLEHSQLSIFPTPPSA